MTKQIGKIYLGNGHYVPVLAKDEDWFLSSLKIAADHEGSPQLTNFLPSSKTKKCHKKRLNQQKKM